MGKITFTPKDFDSVIKLEDLTEYIIVIIQDIRNSDNYGQKLIKKIEEIEKFTNDGLSKDSSIEDLFEAYKKIISISMEIRSLLSKYVSLNKYDNISYAFYYNNERFSTENISMAWLRKGTDGALKLNLNKATQDIKQNFNNELQLKIQEIFNNHYMSYLNAISGMYNGTIEKGRLNRGHIAEAYEAHLAEHHNKYYSILNNPNIESAADRMILASSEKELSNGYWRIHESPDEAWRHIRGALGTQRGTVAGDVGRMQVKQGYDGNQVRLTTLTNLKTGIKVYSDILNPDLNIRDVAYKIARYISEPVAKTDQNIQAYIANKELSGELDKLEITKTTKLVNI